MMGFPTTVVEALNLTTDQATEYLEQLEQILLGKLSTFEPPEDFDQREEVFSLAFAIDLLNRLNSRPDSPFGTEGWIAMLPEEDAEEGP